MGDLTYADNYYPNGTVRTLRSQKPYQETYQPRWDAWGRFVEPLTSQVASVPSCDSTFFQRAVLKEGLEAGSDAPLLPDTVHSSSKEGMLLMVLACSISAGSASITASAQVCCCAFKFYLFPAFAIFKGVS